MLSAQYAANVYIVLCIIPGLICTIALFYNYTLVSNLVCTFIIFTMLSICAKYAAFNDA